MKLRTLFIALAALIARDDELSTGMVGRSFLSRLKKTGVDNNRRMVLIAK